MTTREFIKNFTLGFALWGVGMISGFFISPTRSPSCKKPVLPMGDHFEMPSFKAILINNMEVLLITMSGVLCGGVTSVITLIFNGLAIGIVVGRGLCLGSSWSFIGRAFLPHGIPEVVGLLLASTIGLQGWRVIRHFLNHQRMILWYRSKCVWIIAGVATLLTTLAAWIEIYVTWPRLHF